MRKLSPQDIEQIYDLHKRGMQVSLIAKKFSVTIGAIKYQIKQQAEYCYKKPLCYNDFLQNSIALMEHRLKENYYKDHQLKFVKSEILRMKRQIRVDLRRFQHSED